MDPTTNCIDPNPPGTLVTINLKEYIPRTADPSVPLPLGMVQSTLENSITTTHPIANTEITTDNFSEDDAGLAQFHAYFRICELLSHGFETREAGLSRDDWLTLIANLLADTTNSI